MHYDGYPVYFSQQKKRTMNKLQHITAGAGNNIPEKGGSSCPGVETPGYLIF